MVLDISKLLRKNTKDSNASQVYPVMGEQAVILILK